MRKLNYEDILYALALILALGVRLLNLGGAPLSDIEAGSALQALDLTRGILSVPGPQPGYLALTSLTFSLFGSSEALARLWPALVGSLLVLSPIAFKRVMGRKAALILAFGLALDPGLVALSRQADGRMMAIGFALVALGLAYARKPAGAGIFAGLALLSGPSIWLGLLGLAIAWGLARLVGLSLGAEIFEEVEPPAAPASASPGFLRTWILFTGGTILIVGTLFLSFPAGLGAWASSLSAFIRGWVAPSGVSIAQLMVALVVYQPLALIFGIVAVVRDWARTRSLVWGLGLWILVALMIAMAFTGRQVSDVAWMLVPMWALAAIGLSAYFGEDEKDPISFGQAAAIFVLLALVWLTLAGLHLTVVDAIRLRLLIILGIFVLGILTTAFVAMGWNWGVARNGAVWGVSVALGVYGISAMLGVSYVHRSNPAELWLSSPLPGQANLFADTLKELSLTHTGDATSLEVVSLVDSPAMQWVLRDFSDAHNISLVNEEILPTVIIAPSGSQTQVWSASYRGQDFVWWLKPGWEGVLPEAWVDWLVFRKSSLQSEHIVLWARLDLFPGDVITVDESVEQAEEESDEVK